MNAKTLDRLDYLRIRESAASHCISEEGKERFAERIPFTDKNKADKAKALAEEWSKLIAAGQASFFASWPPVKDILIRLKTPHTVLSLEDIHALGLFCRSALGVKRFFDSDSSEKADAQLEDTQTGLFAGIRTLREAAQNLPDLKEASAKIFRIIDSSGALRNISELQEVKSSIQSIRKSIDHLIKSYTSGERFQNALQSTLPVLRGGRQVLALKADYRGKIKGIVHELSQTGQTLYIEPYDVVQKNNDLIREEFRLEQEIRRILTSLSDDLHAFAGDFEKASEGMAELDLSRAAALWGAENRCVFAENADEEHPLCIRGARHPLLKDKAVPVDVEFRPQVRVLIITGANTGGKTVTVKTIALFALLNQSGLPVPAEQGTRLPFFTSFFADIGDEQNIDQSLSTFSAHMKNIGEMIESADDGSLIVLDELGSGTDPQEGGAVAMAVLDELIRKNAFVLVTTHQGLLKNYGYTHERCMNASVEFNEQTLRPTYRVLMGVPGESRALSIAQKSGLPHKIIEEASAYLENRQTDISVLIKGLSAKYAEAERAEEAFRRKERALAEKEHRLAARELRLHEKDIELRESALTKNERFVSENRKMLENLVRSLREGELTREKTKEVKRFIEGLEQSLDAERENMQEVKNALEDARKRHRSAGQNAAQNGAAANAFAVGADVFAGPSKIRGTIVGKAKKDGWIVQTGSMKINCKEADLAPAPSPLKSVRAAPAAPSFSVEMESAETGASGKGSKTKRQSAASARADRAVYELRLLGMHLEDALKALERQIDLCTLQGLHEFSVIHGKGDGILQEGVHRLLSSYGCVQDFYFAPPEDGGTGKTYVRLG